VGLGGRDQLADQVCLADAVRGGDLRERLTGLLGCAQLVDRDAEDLGHSFGRDAARTTRAATATAERRRLIASTDLTGYLDWPSQAQVFRLERSWREHGVEHRALHYGITSLPPNRADPARLLTLRRGHWAIENRLHRQKDVAFGEDASLVHLGQGPTVMALVRDAALTLLHQAGIRQIAARLRVHAQHPELAVALVVNPPPTRA